MANEVYSLGGFGPYEEGIPMGSSEPLPSEILSQMEAKTQTELDQLTARNEVELALRENMTQHSLNALARVNERDLGRLHEKNVADYNESIAGSGSSSAAQPDGVAGSPAY